MVMGLAMCSLSICGFSKLTGQASRSISKPAYFWVKLSQRS
jgi:hypothetical protein